MLRAKLTKHLAYLIVLVFIVNTAALEFYWYYAIWWFDMPVHFLGGLAAGLLWMLLWPMPTEAELGFRRILLVLLGVLIIGAGWEIYEVVVNIYTAHHPFNLEDMLADICFDLAGGITSLFYRYKFII